MAVGYTCSVLCRFQVFLLPAVVLLNLWPLPKPLDFFPVAVRPRASRRWEHSVINRRGGIMETYFMNGFDNPIDSWITPDCFVLRINQNDFKVLVCRILIYPIRVKNSQICTTASNTLFRGWFERALVFKLVHSLIRGLPYSSTDFNDTRKRPNL